MRPVSVVGIGWIPIEKENALSLKDMGVRAARMALEDAGVEMIDALYASNMLGSELQGQKHIGAMLADGLGLFGIEALQVDATSASGAAALRAAGECEDLKLILLDLKLPGEDGIALLRWMSAQRELQRIPRIVLSSSCSPSTTVQPNQCRSQRRRCGLWYINMNRLCDAADSCINVINLSNRNLFLIQLVWMNEQRWRGRRDFANPFTTVGLRCFCL